MTPHTVMGDLANFNQEKSSKHTTVAVKSGGREGQKLVYMRVCECVGGWGGSSIFVCGGFPV